MGVHIKKNGVDIPLNIKRTSTVPPAANNINYNNSSSGLTATNVQGAIDEVVDIKADKDGFKTINGQSLYGSGDLDVLDGEANPALLGNEAVLKSIELNDIKYKLYESCEEYNSYFSEGVNVKDFGAEGDGVTDDSQAFIDAIAEAVSENKTVIIIPQGKYNLNNVDISLTTSLSFAGEASGLSFILNSNLTAQYGIECIGITFDGGTLRTFGDDGTIDSGTPRNVRQETVILLCSPKVDTTVHFKKCVFRNAGTGIWAFRNGKKDGGVDTNQRFFSDIIEDCLFEDLICMGIWHSLIIDNFKCINSIFRNIGTTKAYTGTHTDSWCCLKVGDTTNTNDFGVTNAVITHCHFEHLQARNAASASSSHAQEAYFIGIHGEYLEIYDNVFKDLLGFDGDHEGLYTKAKKMNNIYNNYFENAGAGGEGYICCKNSKWPADERFNNIHDNILVGDSGIGISTYGNAYICNNIINIKNVGQAIRALSGNYKKAVIRNNFIYCGIDNYYYEGEIVESYHPDNSLCFTSGFDDVDFSYNRVALKDNLTDGVNVTYSVVKLGGTTHTVIANNNNIYSDNYNRGIYVMNTAGIVTDSLDVKANYNYFFIKPPTRDKLPVPIYLQLQRADCRKTVEVINNTFGEYEEKVDGQTVVYVTSRFTNGMAQIILAQNDGSIVKLDTQQPNVAFRYGSSKMFKISNGSYVEVPNENWVG